MNSHLKPKFLISALSTALSTIIVGCSCWPEHGQGGDAQVDTSHEYYIDQADSDIGQIISIKGALETQWSIHSLKLDTLVLRGGQECLPGRVREVSMMARRSRRELDGNLLEDARNTVIIFHRKLDELERRLIYIQRHTQCGQVSSSGYSIAELNSHQKYLNRKLFLLTLLNDEYSFDIDSDQLTRHYQEKLIIAGHYLNQDISIRLYINGHADAEGDFGYNQSLALQRAKNVQQVLITSGVDSKRLVLRSFGEQLPIETNANTIGRMRNRRVSIDFIEQSKFYIPGSDGLLFKQNNNIFGSIDKAESTDKVQHLKHWHKNMDEGYGHGD
ncbi:MAG: OmpA family protein [Oleispira sp.]|nr:OmpA family protein [Oleispira sp.]